MWNPITSSVSTRGSLLAANVTDTHDFYRAQLKYIIRCVSSKISEALNGHNVIAGHTVLKYERIFMLLGSILTWERAQWASDVGFFFSSHVPIILETKQSTLSHDIYLLIINSNFFFFKSQFFVTV